MATHWRYQDEKSGIPAYFVRPFLDDNKNTDLVTHFNNVQLDKASVVNTKEENIYKVNENKRKTNVKFFTNPQLQELCNQTSLIANSHMGLDYKINCIEAFQFARYEKDDKFDWHIDGQQCQYSKRVWDNSGGLRDISRTGNPMLINTVRKLSGIILLNTDYSGGELQFKWTDSEGEHIKTAPLKKGDLVVFPSSLMHRVTPITKGTRHSITFWIGGPPLK
jgi:PKHD-type hydroxylase